MEVFVRVKALGRRRDILAPTAYAIPDGLESLRQLLTALVQQEVARYNAKGTDVQLIPFLTGEELEAQAQAGRVSFGRIYSDKKADPAKAAANAIQCWEDGLVRVFLDERELTDLDAPLTIPENGVFTFIRLTFLSGGIW